MRYAHHICGWVSTSEDLQFGRTLNLTHFLQLISSVNFLPYPGSTIFPTTPFWNSRRVEEPVLMWHRSKGSTISVSLDGRKLRYLLHSKLAVGGTLQVILLWVPSMGMSASTDWLREKILRHFLCKRPALANAKFGNTGKQFSGNLKKTSGVGWKNCYPL